MAVGTSICRFWNHRPAMYASNSTGITSNQDYGLISKHLHSISRLWVSERERVGPRWPRLSQAPGSGSQGLHLKIKIKMKIQDRDRDRDRDTRGKCRVCGIPWAPMTNPNPNPNPNPNWYTMGSYDETHSRPTCPL